MLCANTSILKSAKIDGIVTKSLIQGKETKISKYVLTI